LFDLGVQYLKEQLVRQATVYQRWINIYHSTSTSIWCNRSNINSIKICNTNLQKNSHKTIKNIREGNWALPSHGLCATKYCTVFNCRAVSSSSGTCSAKSAKSQSTFYSNSQKMQSNVSRISSFALFSWL